MQVIRSLTLIMCITINFGAFLPGVSGRRECINQLIDLETSLLSNQGNTENLTMTTNTYGHIYAASKITSINFVEEFELLITADINSSYITAECPTIPITFEPQTTTERQTIPSESPVTQRESATATPINIIASVAGVVAFIILLLIISGTVLTIIRWNY